MKTESQLAEINIIDTFPAFEKYWRQYRDSSTNAQVNAWVSEYMVNWPALLKKQIKQYQSEGIDWKKVARERVFPNLEERLPEMRLARKRLLEESQKIIRRAQLRFNDRHSLYVIIYVGIGLGAGWATTYVKSPALLFGLENIAEEGWTDKSEVRGLITHELGHLFHSFWRESVGKRFRSGPLWDLYTEGFADRFEQLLEDNENSHIAKDSDGQEWLDWCQENRQWIASEILKRLERKGDLRTFFGSWYKIRGHSQIGYFMGSELIKEFEKYYPLKKIATLDTISQRMKRMLIDTAKGRL